MENLIQTRIKEFENRIIPLKNFISGLESKSLEETNNIFFDGFRTLGIGELYARQYERESQLDILKENAKHSLSQFEKYNKKGVARINDAINKLQDLKNEFADIGTNQIKDLKARLEEDVQEFKLQCVHLEIKGKDTATLFKSIDEVVATLQKDGTKGVIKLAEQRMQELIALRKSDNRGAIDNFPIWKVAAIVAALGIWILAFLRCGIRRCSVQEGTTYVILFAIAAIVSNFC